MATGRKTGGRAPGSPNKATKNFRNQISRFLSRNWKTVQKDFDKMDPKERLAFVEKLLKYTTPALSAINATIDYESLSDADLDKIISSLKNQE